MPRTKKKILFVHYRTGERDGVGLEIERRAKILTDFGGKVFYLTGFEALSRPNAFVVKEIDMRSNFNKFLREDCFINRICDEGMAIALYHQHEAKIYQKIQKIFAKIQPDLIFVHNLFSHAYNLPATTALIKILDRYETCTVTVNHDFWFERRQFLTPKHHFIREILTTIPPNRPYIFKHQVINSFASAELKSRRGIQAETIGDYFDYTQPLPTIDNYNQDLPHHFGIAPNDLVVLHATRITERKTIENAIIFARTLEKKLRSRAPLAVNGKLFRHNSRVVLFFPNFVEVDSLEYYKKIKLLAERHGLTVIWGSDKFLPARRQKNGVKLYSFWDSYVFADLVTYTSTWEGFGNQLLEAFYFKKLAVIFEYPVFARDIKKEGYEIISLGKQTLTRNGLQFVKQKVHNKAAQEAIRLLTNPKQLTRLVNKNFRIARQHHNESFLRHDLQQLILTHKRSILL